MTLHGYVMAEIIHSTVHMHHDIIAWPRATFVHVYLYKHHLKHPLLLHQPWVNRARLQFLKFLEFSSSFPACILSTLGSSISETVVLSESMTNSEFFICSEFTSQSWTNSKWLNDKDVSFYQNTYAPTCRCLPIHGPLQEDAPETGHSGHLGMQGQGGWGRGWVSGWAETHLVL